jgi:hypothetical protein
MATTKMVIVLVFDFCDDPVIAHAVFPSTGVAQLTPHQSNADYPYIADAETKKTL